MARRVRRICLACMLLAVVVPREGAAGPVLADVVADFVPGVNPGDTVMPPASGSGQWRYLASATLDPTDPGAGLADLEWDVMGELFERPGLDHMNGFSEDALRLGSDVLLMHPANVTGDVQVARWIAGPGEAGQVDIVGNVAKADPGGGDGIRFVVFVDGVPLFDQAVAFDDTVGIPIALQGVEIAEGSTADFVVSKIGDPFFDTTSLTAVITQVMGPTTTSTTSITTTTVATTTLPGTARFPEGQKLLVTRHGSGEHRLQLIGKGAEIETAQPCETDGLLVVEAAGVGAAPVAFELEAALWKPISAKSPERGCKYRKGPAARTVQIKRGKSLKVIAAAVDVGVPLGTDPRAVRVELRHGAVRHCFEFGPGTKGKFKVDKKLLAKRAGRATGCPEPAAGR